VLTVNGRVQLKRTRWHAPGEGATTVIDAAMDAAEAAVSVGVRELACRLNQHAGSFRKTAENLCRAAQIQTSSETVRQLVEQEGKGALRLERSGTIPIGWEASQCTSPEGVTRVYLGSDGVKVPLVTDAEKKARRQRTRRQRRRRGKRCRRLAPAKRGADQRYKEFKVVTYYDHSGTHQHVSVTRGNHQKAGWLMRRNACRIKLHEADQKVANVDGADWIRNQMRGQSLPLDAIGLDFYHLAENVHQARRRIYGEEDGDGMTWAGEVLHVVKHEGYEAFWERLVAWRTSWRGRKRQAADRLLHYVAQRRGMIAYPAFIARGWQIGSGPTEAQCKTTTARLKGRGRRWDADNAEAVATLSALEQSGQWRLYWRTRLAGTG